MGSQFARLDRGRDSGPAVKRVGRAIKGCVWKNSPIPSVDRAFDRSYPSPDQSSRHGPGIEGIRGRTGSAPIICFENERIRFRGARGDCRPGAGKSLDEA